MKHVERLSRREIRRRTNPLRHDPHCSPNLSRRARSCSRTSRRWRGAHPRGPRETQLRGRKDDRRRSVPRAAGALLPPPRDFQRTRCRCGKLARFDLCEPRSEIPVGPGRTRRGYVVTRDLPYSRALTGALVFSNQPTILLDELARRGAYTVYRIAPGGLSPAVHPQSVAQSSMWFCVPGWLSDRAAPLVS
jgi:hypothetical protein